ncbi:MAG: hypothetical protein VX529_07410 [Pseudomonadota bacterium]|nr:hypothetical protein [Pseudomonadota bacterium]
MSEWKEFKLQLDFGKNQADITWTKGRALVAVHNLPFDRPGEQTESESQEAARQSAKRVLQELLDQI